MTNEITIKIEKIEELIEKRDLMWAEMLREFGKHAAGIGESDYSCFKSVSTFLAEELK